MKIKLSGAFYIDSSLPGGLKNDIASIGVGGYRPFERLVKVDEDETSIFYGIGTNVFFKEEAEGSCIYDDTIDCINRLVSDARKYNFTITGHMDITGDERMRIRISGNKIIERPLDVVNAETDILIDELIDRGVLSEDFERHSDHERI